MGTTKDDVLDFISGIGILDTCKETFLGEDDCVIEKEFSLVNIGYGRDKKTHSPPK